MTRMTRILSLAAVALVVACNDQELLTDPTAPTSPGSGLAVAASMANSTGGPMISTAKDDYVPHEKVEMIGSGWQPEETVTLTLAEDPKIHEDRSFAATADSLGSFLYNEWAPEDHHAGVRFVLTAVGQSSGFEAQTTFTDAITIGGLTFNTNGNGTNGELTFNVPQVNAGDVVIAQVTVAKMLPTQLICRPSAEWISIRRTNNKSDPNESDIIQETFYHVAPAATAGPVSHTWKFKTDCSNSTNISDKRAAGGAIRYTGVDASLPQGPIDAHDGSAGSSSGPFLAPEVNTSAGGAQVIRFFGVFKNTNVTVHSTDVTGSTRRYIAQSSGGAERTAAAFDVTQAIGGPTGSFRANVASGAEWVSQTVALRMAVACTAPAITGQPASVSKTVGESATFSVTATGTGLTYQWFKNDVAIGGATNASYTIPSVGATDAGSYKVVVTGGCGTPVTSTAATLTVAVRPTTTIVTSSPSSSVFGQPVTFEATVSPTNGSGTPTGSVNFIESGTCGSPGTTHVSAVALSGGKASFNTDSLSVASHTIIACYSGDDEFASSDGNVQHTVNKASTSTAVTSSSAANTSVFGESVTFEATVSVTAPGAGTPGGSVNFIEGGTCASPATTHAGGVALSGGKASFDIGTLNAGPHTITACYVGSSEYLPSNGSVQQTVNRATPAFSNLSSPTITYGDTPTTISGTISAGSLVPPGNVSITLNGVTQQAAIAASGNFSSSFVTNGLGVANSPYAITYSYAGSVNFNPVSPDGSGSLTVNQAATSTAMTLSAGPYIVNGQVTVNFTVAPTVARQYASNPGGTVEVKNGSDVLCSAILPATSCSFTPSTVGNYSLTANYGGDGNFLSSASEASVITVKYNFDGFYAPVDRPSTLNVSKAGQAIPLKWRLTDANGLPILNLTTVTIKVGSLACNTNPVTDLIEEYASGASGLQNQGDGYYQFNWKTPTSYALSCRSIGLDFGGYVEWPLANFNFKK